MKPSRIGTLSSTLCSKNKLVRADRDGNWALYLQAVQVMLTIFAAFDSTNYLRCLTVSGGYSRASKHNTRCKAFIAGKFVVKRAPGNFNAVGADYLRVAKECIWNDGQHKKEYIRSNMGSHLS